MWSRIYIHTFSRRLLNRNNFVWNILGDCGKLLFSSARNALANGSSLQCLKMESALGELRSRLSMTEVEVNIKSTQSQTPSLSPPVVSAGPLRVIKEASMKKSRKSKTPICRSQRKLQLTEDSKLESQIAGKFAESVLMRSKEMELAEKKGPKASPEAVPGLPPPPPGTGFKSYSDYMRSLAAKYNNNE